MTKKASEEKKNKKKRQREDFEEADFEEEEFEDYRETKSPAKASEEFAGFTERMDFTIDDLDELLEEKSSQRRGHFDEDDTFKMDFIDLD